MDLCYPHKNTTSCSTLTILIESMYDAPQTVAPTTLAPLIFALATLAPQWHLLPRHLLPNDTCSRDNCYPTTQSN